jgi:PAS domain S-box-containing protein
MRNVVKTIRRTGAALMLAFLAATVVLAMHPSLAVREPPYLLQTLNTIFLGILPVLAAFFALRAYLKLGSIGFLFMGAGLLAFGAGSTIAGWLILSSGGPNVTVTVHNGSIFAASILSLLGTLWFVSRATAETARHRRATLSLLCAALLLCIAAWAVAASFGITPPFFTQGEGPTFLRQVILCVAMIFYATASLLLAVRFRRRGSAVLDLFMVSLGLVAIGLLALLFQKGVGTPIGWLGRFAQYLSGCCTLAAVLRTVDMGRRRHIGVEEALAAFFDDAEDSYRSLVDALTDAVLTVDAGGSILMWNAGARRMFGYAAVEAAGAQAGSLLFAPEGAEAFRRRIQDPAVGPASPAVMETACRRKDGTVFPAECSFSLRNLEVGPVWTCVVHDITRRKTAERELRESELQFRTIAEKMPVLVMIARAADETIVYANAACREALGRREEEIVGGSAAEMFYDPGDRQRIQEALRGQGGVSRLPLRARGRDGTPAWILASFIPISFDGSPAVIAAALDISDRMRAEEELRRAQQELERRVEERTVELATTVERLQQEAGARVRTQEELQRMNFSLQENADHLRRLSSELTMVEQRERKRLALILHDDLQQLLIAARFRVDSLAQAQETGVRGAAADVEALLSQAIDTTRTLTSELSPPILFESGLLPALQWLARWMEEKHGLAVDLCAQGEEVPLQETTSILLFRAVRELLVNARKHAKVNAAMVLLKREPARLEIIVRDSGEGFQAEKVPYKAGIGLFSLREQLAVQGGELDIQSAPGKGSSFRIVMPLPEVPPAEQDPLAPSARSGIAGALPWSGRATDSGQATRVLLVDDHPVVRQGLRDLLARHCDIEVIGEASDGEQAVREALRLLPDVVVMDVSMPKMSGIEAAAVIHRARPEIRIIGHSIYEAADQAAAMAEAGACAFVSKSGPTAALIEAIRGGRSA